MSKFKSESFRETLTTHPISYRKSRENEFVKKEEHLYYKFNELQTISRKRKKQQVTTKYVKLSIIKLTDIALTDHQKSLLNLGPRFVPIQKRIPFIEIITAKESVD